MTGDELNADVVVAGGGMAGLAAALAAAEAGARVVVLEKGDQPGGSARLSGGLLWTEPTHELLAARNPHGDPDLGRALVDDYEDAATWLREQGLEMTERLTELFGTGEGYRLGPDMPTVIDRLAERAEGAGAEVHCGVRVTGLERDERGGLTGVRAVGADGELLVRARAAVLATGGFQANVELLTRYVTRYADLLYVRSNRGSTGDGLTIGLGAGAASSCGLHAFYGHLLPAPPAQVTPERYIALTQYYSVHSVLVNARGDRFVDESIADEYSAQALAREPHALGFILLDSVAAERVSDPPAPRFPQLNRLEQAERAGGRVLRADTLDVLAAGIDEAGGNGRRSVLALEEYNRLVTDDPRRLAVPRAARRRALDRPPFTAVPVRPAITFTEGGLRIDASAQVLDRDLRPIPGLYAAGADGGGVFYEHYAGGLALATVFGRRAGGSAAVHAASVSEARA